MPTKKKTWIEKRDHAPRPHVTTLTKDFSGIASGAKLLISSPLEIDDFIRSLPKGSFCSPVEMRNQLARRHKADATCPLSTGIFLRIVVEAAREDLNAKSIIEITPFWRMIDAKSKLSKKMGLSDEDLKVYRSMNGEDEDVDRHKT
jgi:hypothetical protein